MKKPSKTISFLLSGLLLIWGASSWFIAKQSKQQFTQVLETISASKANNYFDIEMLNHSQNLYGSSAEIKLVPKSALIDEKVEDWLFILKQSNGPVFINDDGVQLGLSRWQLSIDEANTPDVPVGSAVVDFSENAEFRFELSQQSFSSWGFNAIKVEGGIDSARSAYNLDAQVSGLTYRNDLMSLSFDDFLLESKRRIDPNAKSPKKALTNLTLNTQGGALALLGQAKKIPFNLQSHGSLWANNDTLSADLKIASIKSDEQAANNFTKVENLSILKLDVSLQFRELLADGFWEYLSDQSDILSLLQQADWAMEEVETPEQQDFLRSLLTDASRIQNAHLSAPLKPLLIAGKSQLALNVKLSQDNADAVSQLTLGGAASDRSDEPTLDLKGNISVGSKMLNSRSNALLDEWSSKRWLRRYENEFESDLSVRGEQVKLNNIVVSLDSLSAELSQTLVDQ